MTQSPPYFPPSSLPASLCKRGAAAAGSHWRCPVFSGAATRFWWAATDPQRFASPSRLWCEPGSTSLRRPVTRQITCGWSGAGTRVAISRGGRFGQVGVRRSKQTKNKGMRRNAWSRFGEAGEELIKAPLRFSLCRGRQRPTGSRRRRLTWGRGAKQVSRKDVYARNVARLKAQRTKFMSKTLAASAPPCYVYKETE